MFEGFIPNYSCLLHARDLEELRMSRNWPPVYSPCGSARVPRLDWKRGSFGIIGALDAWKRVGVDVRPAWDASEYFNEV